MRAVTCISLTLVAMLAGVRCHMPDERDGSDPGSCTCTVPLMPAPVCAEVDGEQMSFDSACFAACAGGVDLEDGPCASPPPSLRPSPISSPSSPPSPASPMHDWPIIGIGNCSCPVVWVPVCARDLQGVNTTYASACAARCNNATLLFNNVCEAGPNVPRCNDCPDPSRPAPVCATDGTTFESTCLVLCRGLRVAYNGTCRSPPPRNSPSPSLPSPRLSIPPGRSPPRSISPVPSIPPPGQPPSPSCYCAAIYVPVCGINDVTYPSACEANCAGIAVKSNGVCGAKPGSCDCTKEYVPVCGRSGTTHANACLARCETDPVAYNGTCTPANWPAECKGAVEIDQPVCVLFKGAGVTRQFKNPCFAKAAGYSLDKGDRYYRGTCSSTCDERCNPVNGTAVSQYRKDEGQPICCAQGVEQINWCYAQCYKQYEKQDLSKCIRGTCKTGRANYALRNLECAAGDATVPTCQGMPMCSKQRCAQDSSASCIATSTCAAFFKMEYLATTCAPVFLRDNGTLVRGCGSFPAVQSNTTTCSLEGAQCTLPPVTSPTSPSTPQPCCDGFRCWPGLSPRPGQIFGLCVNASLPNPVGRRRLLTAAHRHKAHGHHA